ncbi:MAG: hypothetical protein Q9227_007352 [Pyrenula ochraceoflavens]
MQTARRQSTSMISPASTHDSRMGDVVDPELMRSPQHAHTGIGGISMAAQAPSFASQLDPSWGYDLNLLSHAASQLEGHNAAGGLNTMGDVPQPPPQIQAPQSAPAYSERQYPDAYAPAPSVYETPTLGDPMQDFTVFLDSVGLSSDWHSGVFNGTGVEQPADSGLSPNVRFDQLGPSPRAPQNGDYLGEPPRVPTAEENSFSRFGSRLPSLQPESRDPDDIRDPYGDETMGKNRPAWEISNQDRDLFIQKLGNFVGVLPRNFVTPSRHSLSRYLAGYINGFHEHLPFIHVPTLSVALNAPELVLALAAVGAQYRFENARGIELFYAAKAVVMEQIARRDNSPLPPSWDKAGPMSQSPTSPIDFQRLAQMANESQYPPAGRARNGPRLDDDALMETIRALLLLTAFATWEKHRELLTEALTFQSILARLVRESGLSNPENTPNTEELTWEQWIRLEGDKRTKMIVYCFFNLHSVTWNVPPLILNGEVRLDLPEPADEWKATNATQWRRLHSKNNTQPLSFQDAYAKLFSQPPNNSNPPVTPLGNYILILAIIQQIFFARQLCSSWPDTPATSLRKEDIETLEGALSAWKAGWKRTPESSLDPQNPNGPVAFTSTALLGLAYIRLHVDLGPVRHLESRDPFQVAMALKQAPPLQRSRKLIMALLHSAHALSIPVRLGIDFVAKTQTFFWSIQHSLCSLECAFLLSKWLATIPADPNQAEPKLEGHERKLLLWVRSLLDETEMASSPTRQGGGGSGAGSGSGAGRKSGGGIGEGGEVILDEGIKIKQLSIAVVRVWAKTFKGNTSWAIVDLIGSSLEMYANLLEADRG